MLEDAATRSWLRAKLGRMFRRDGVPDTSELDRVLHLPRRVWEEDPDLEELVELMTQAYRTPGGEQRLWPVQAKALQELHDLGFGLFGKLPVGAGKTILSYLAPYVLDDGEGKLPRALLVVPAKLRDKTYREFRALGRHWKAAWFLDEFVVSYEKLGREGATELLESKRPDLLILDEAHRLKNVSAAVTRRISAYVDAHPELRVVAMSGTITTRSLRDFAHVLRWCLPGERMPLPQVKSELEVWAAAVDEIKVTEDRVPVDVGALTKFCSEEEKAQGRTGVRAALRRRFDETPGIVGTRSQGVAASLNIVLTRVDGYNAVTRVLAQKLRAGEKPNGDPVTDEDLSARWRIFRTLTSGFWYDWATRPSEVWLDARRGWKKVVRRVLADHLPGLESEALVAKAALAGKFAASYVECYRVWTAVKDACSSDVVPVWVDDRMVRFVDAWRREHEGIVWVSEVALGKKLESELGMRYFHELGRDGTGMMIEDADPRAGSIVASVGSNSEGRNLQAWNDSLVVSPPPTGTVFEQLLGRMHRPGQEADEVWCEVAVGCAVEWECWCQALRDTRYADAVEGSKKLLVATIDGGFELPPGDGGLW